MRSTSAVRISFALLALLALAPAASAVDVTACGQAVPARQSAVLAADLVCDPELLEAVHLGPSATLDLAGHSITGARVGVGCHGRCRVSGPGEIIAPTVFGVAQLGSKGAFRAPVRIEHLTVRDAPGNGTGIQIAGHGFRLDDLTLERNAVGVCCGGGFHGTRLTIRDNRDKGVEATDIDLRDFTVTGSPVGVYTLPYNFRRRQSVVLRDGTMSENGVDIRSLDRPIVRDVSCAHSEDLDGVPWGVCSDD